MEPLIPPWFPQCSTGFILGRFHFSDPLGDLGFRFLPRFWIALSDNMGADGNSTFTRFRVEFGEEQESWVGLAGAKS